MVLHSCCTCGAMHIWYCVHESTSGDVSMWCCVYVIHMVQCESGIVYMSCIWYFVHVVSCTCRASGAVYV